MLLTDLQPVGACLRDDVDQQPVHARLCAPADGDQVRGRSSYRKAVHVFTEGILGEDNVEKNPHLFLAYQLFLAKRLGSIRASEERSNKKQKLGTWQERLTKDKLKALWSKDLGLFCCPNKIRKGWRGAVTTDGVIASWHLHKDDETVLGDGKKKEKKKKNKNTVVVEKLENKLYGTHGAKK
jgi:hypothetical protein